MSVSGLVYRLGWGQPLVQHVVAPKASPWHILPIVHRLDSVLQAAHEVIPEYHMQLSPVQHAAPNETHLLWAVCAMCLPRGPHAQQAPGLLCPVHSTCVSTSHVCCSLCTTLPGSPCVLALASCHSPVPCVAHMAGPALCTMYSMC